MSDPLGKILSGKPLFGLPGIFGGFASLGSFVLEKLVNSLVEIPKLPAALDQQTGSQVYNQQSAQNLARLQQAKPALYGRFKVFPDLVSQPWTEYVDHEQYLYQLMAATLGKAELEQLYFGDTEVESLQEVTYEVYQPGETVDLFHTNVATNEEVKDLALALETSASAGPVAVNYSGDTATTNDGSTPFMAFAPGRAFTITGTRFNNGTFTTASVSATGDSITITGTFTTELAEYIGAGGAELTSLSRITETSSGNAVGPFFVGVRGSTASKAAIDIEFPRGLYAIDNDGNTVSSSVSILVERRVEGTAPWTTVATEVFTAATLTPQRYTREYALPSTGDLMLRHEIQLTLQTPLSNTTRTSNEPRWTGLRGFLGDLTAVPGPGKALLLVGGLTTFPDLTVLAMKVRVTGQLSGGAGSRRINGIFQRILPVWNGAAWVDQATSSVVWAFADVIRNTEYGLGKPDTALDLPALLTLDAQLTARGDYFNGYFDRSLTAWEALKSIARCGRCTPLTDGRTFTLLRDEPRALRSAMFTDRNIAADSFGLQFTPRKPETPRGLRVTYHDPVSFQVKTVVMGDENQTTDLTLFGCTSRAQAWREGNFVLNETLYRRLNVSFETEEDGFVPSFGSSISVQSFWADFGQSAEVESVSMDGLTLTISNPFDWSAAGPFTVQLRDGDGKPTDALPATRGSADDVVVLASSAPIAIYTGSDRERTHIALSSTSNTAMDVLVRAISAKDEHHASVAAVIDDPRVHAEPGAVPAE